MPEYAASPPSSGPAQYSGPHCPVYSVLALGAGPEQRCIHHWGSMDQAAGCDSIFEAVRTESSLATGYGCPQGSLGMEAPAWAIITTYTMS